MKPLQGIIAVCIYAVYLLIIALYPFDATADSSNKLNQYWTSFLSSFPTAIDQLPISNLIKKFLFSIPFGIFLYYIVKSVKRSYVLVLLLACVSAFLINFLVELSQTFFADRHASAVDLLSKTMGSLCGTLLARLCPNMVAERVGRIWWHIDRSRVLLLFALVWAAFPGIAFAIQYPWFNFRNWDARFSLQIANEATGEKPWLGSIYLAAIYNRALSSEEISHHFQREVSSEGEGSRRADGLIAFYTFDEGAGHTIHDRANFGSPLNLTFSPDSQVQWLSDPKGLKILAPAIIRSYGPATKLFTACTATAELSIELWIRPENLTQSGSARMISFSDDWRTRNFMLAQTQADIVFRVRTPFTGRDGGGVHLHTDNRFLKTERMHLVGTYKDGLETLYVNGTEHIHSIDLAADGMIGFPVKRNRTAKIAYSFFYFFPLTCLAAIASAGQRGFIAKFLPPMAIGTCVLGITEIFQAIAFDRWLDLPLLGYGALVGTLGALSGIAFTKGSLEVTGHSGPREEQNSFGI